MAQAVDDAGRRERHQRHLQRPDGDARQAEQRGVDEEQGDDPAVAQAGIDMALDPIVGRALAVLLQQLGILRGFLVQLDAAPQHGVDAGEARAVRILGGLAAGVVLAVDRHPLLGHHRGGQPVPEAQEVAHDRVQVHAAVGGAAVQVEGGAHHGDLAGDQEIQRHLPGAGLGETGQQPIDNVGGHRDSEGAASAAGSRDGLSVAVQLWRRNPPMQATGGAALSCGHA